MDDRTTDHRLPKRGTSLAEILREKPNMIEALAECLDTEMRIIKNWKHLAQELRVDYDVIKRLEEYRDFSPTIRLFEYLESAQPDLTIKQLKEALLNIKRNDLFKLLVTARCDDCGKVSEVIMNRSPNPMVVLDDIALQLDTRSLVLKNWRNLAMQLGVPREICQQLDCPLTGNRPSLIFEYLASAHPQMTLKTFKETLRPMEREDLVNLLQGNGIEDDMLLKDVLEPGSDRLEKMCNKLNHEVVGVRGLPWLAQKLHIPDRIYNNYGAEATVGRKSPTKELFDWLKARSPDLAITDIVKALDRIQRNDAIQIITRFFPGAIDSSTEQPVSGFDLSSLALPLLEQDMEHGSSFSKDRLTSRHNGYLPDRIDDLIGREDICEKVLASVINNPKTTVEIVGGWGYGKTCVVTEVAHQLISKGYYIVYINPRGVKCVEELAVRVLESLNNVAEDRPRDQAIRTLRLLPPDETVLIIENIDNLLYLEKTLGATSQSDVLDFTNAPNSAMLCAKSLGLYKKSDFLEFFEDIGKSTSKIRFIFTSREEIGLSSFQLELIKLEPLRDEHSRFLFVSRFENLTQKELDIFVRFGGGVPMVICAVLSNLQGEDPTSFSQRLCRSPPQTLLKELSPDYFVKERRIDHCLQLVFNRLDDEHQNTLVMLSIFPHRFTKEQFTLVFQELIPKDPVQTRLTCLKRSTLLHYENESKVYSLHNLTKTFCFIQNFHNKAVMCYIRYYSKFIVALCDRFLSKDSGSAIQQFRNEKHNIMEAILLCCDEEMKLERSFRNECIDCFNKAAVFLAKVMRNQEFKAHFCKLSHRCRDDDKRYSECLTIIGMKVILSCTCSPCICCKALYSAKVYLEQANKIQSSITTWDTSIRAQCLSKLGLCYVREGDADKGFQLLNQALERRDQHLNNTKEDRERVMRAACLNDLAAALMYQRKHLAAIQTRMTEVLPTYESILGDHAFLATTLNNMGNSYYALGDNNNAIKFTQRALNIRQNLLGHHQETARSLYDLGVAYSAKEEYESALKYLKRAATLQEEVLDTYEEKIKTHQELSFVLRKLGREKEAEIEDKKLMECIQQQEP